MKQDYCSTAYPRTLRRATQLTSDSAFSDDSCNARPQELSLIGFMASEEIIRPGGRIPQQRPWQPVIASARSRCPGPRSRSSRRSPYGTELVEHVARRLGHRPACCPAGTASVRFADDLAVDPVSVPRTGLRRTDRDLGPGRWLSTDTELFLPKPHRRLP
jgi:hypothetical protein